MNQNDNSIVNTTFLKNIKEKYLRDTHDYDVNKTDFFSQYSASFKATAPK